MKGELKAPSFERSATVRLWDAYMSRAEALTRPLTGSQRRDILLELRAHLLESMLDQPGDESERLQQAQQRLGEPEAFMPDWVEGRLEHSADPGLVLHSHWQLLKLSAARGLRGLANSMLYGFGHMIVFYCFALAILKVIFPDNIGWYTAPAGWPIAGYVDAEGFTEHLGWWFIPIVLAVGSAILLLLNFRRRSSAAN
jgi:hypothetical protein